MIPKIIFSDVDGTLLNSSHKVLPGTVYAIRELKKKGIPFVIISARSPSGIRPILQENHFTCPMISYSGALVLDENENVLYSEGFSRDDAAEMIRFIESNQLDCTWNIYSMDTWIVKDRSDPRVRREENIVKANSIEGSALSLDPSAKVGKILLMCNPDKILDIEQASSDILIEIMQGGITKSTGVTELCRLWNIPMEDTLAFGDHYNDLEMLETVALPFLMGNAPEELKERFENVTASNNDEGIYKALLRLGIIEGAVEEFIP